MGLFNWISEKLNPAQDTIAGTESSASRSNKKPFTTQNAFEGMEIVNRCVNLITDSSAEVKFDVQDKRNGMTAYGSGIKQVTLDNMLNVRPNMFMDINTFWRLIYLDMVLEGWAFIHYDEAEKALYYIPAAGMEVFADRKYYINKFVYDGKITYSPDEIIFIKDNAYTQGQTSQISGYSRLQSSLKSIIRADKLEHFKEKFFDNGTVIGMVVETEQSLSTRAKERKREEIRLDHNPRNNKSNVLILDGGAKAKQISVTKLNDLGIDQDLTRFEKNICKALGVPHILIESGNNANIRPNLELFYYLTILPIAKKVESALEFFFAFDIKSDTSDIKALAPDKEKEAKELTAKVNNGIITGDEARESLRLTPMGTPEMTEIRIPVNVAGSATGVSGQEGGSPGNGNNDD